MTDGHSYDDIIDLPHHSSSRYPRMSMRERAAQFAPFAALTGFDGVIAETGRETQARVELSESETEALNRALSRVDALCGRGEHPRLTLLYFTPDALKPGGAYTEYTGRVKAVDAARRLLIFSDENGRADGLRVPIDDIREIRPARE